MAIRVVLDDIQTTSRSGGSHRYRRAITRTGEPVAPRQRVELHVLDQIDPLVHEHVLMNGEDKAATPFSGMTSAACNSSRSS